MKNVTKAQTAQQNVQFNKNKKRAENKDDLDSREGEEQLTKGDGRTHNRKEEKSKKPSQNR